MLTWPVTLVGWVTSIVKQAEASQKRINEFLDSKSSLDDGNYSLKDKNSKQSIFYQNLVKLLEIKRKQKAFHPNAKRLNINLGSKIFCYERISLDKKQSIICITNLSTKLQYIKINKNLNKYRDLLGGKIFFTLDKKIKLDPCQTIWLSNR